MTNIDLAHRVACLAQAVNSQDWLTQLGRACTLTFVLQVGDDEHFVRVESGRIAQVQRGPALLRSYAFAIRGAQASWAQFWQAEPARGFHDLFAMTTYGHVRIDGDLDPLRRHLPYIKGVLAALREPRTSDAPTPATHADSTPGGAALDPMVGRYVYLDFWGARQRVYFEEAGSGIPLVCLHTAGAHSSQWRHLLCDERITSRFRVLAFDLPWHGKTTPPAGWEHDEYQLTSDGYVEAIMAFIGGLALEDPVVIGCSMGGRVVIRLAADHAARLGAVIGLEATDRPTPWWDDSWLDSPEFARGDFCAAMVSGLVAPQSPAQYRSETLWHYFQSGSDVFKGDMHFFRSDSDFAAKVAAIDTRQCPVYLLTGEYDYSCQAENTQATAARIDGASAQAMQDMGHFPMSENPEAFSRYLLPVLDEIATDHGR